jgi:outer membrane lipoprotein carrier protein
MIFLLLFLATPLDTTISRLEDHYNHLDSLRASFVQQYRATESGAVREESGIVYLRKPGKMRWEYTRPEAKLFLTDGKDAYFYVQEDKQATRFSVKDSSDARIPLRFLLGKLNLRRIFAKIEVVTDIAPVDPGDILLKLYPKKGESFQQIYLEIDPQSRIRRLVIDESDGSRSDFRLAAEEANPRLESDLFHFVPPPGTAIVDERSGR